ncbi:MAG TPA: alpha/beta hydrolase [Dehalococcoidia bacterium]|nr:alpha/beta hydrolase [Dehalococcoidia bacterium]
MSTVKSGYIWNKSNALNYLEWGDPGSPDLVLLHGITGTAYSWKPVAERLQNQYHCLALNLRGRGDSGPSPERRYDFDLFVEDVQALVDQLGLGRFLLIGHSMGGRAALAYAAAHPEYLDALVIVDISPGMTDEGAWGLKRAMEATPAEFGSWEEALAYVKRGFPSLSEELIKERAPYMFRREPGGSIVWKYDPLVREEWHGPDLPPRAKAHLWNELAQLQCPMLLIKGEKTNQLTSEICERMVENGPDSRWVEIPNTTHFVHDDNLQGFLAEVQPFLERFAGIGAPEAKTAR